MRISILIKFVDSFAFVRDFFFHFNMINSNTISVSPFQVMNLTDNIQLILDAMRMSTVVEVQVILESII